MINKPPPVPGGLILTLLLVMSSPVIPSAHAATKYKKQTVVDFEGALVEGKSRKPYSAYLTQQKEAALTDLNGWAPDPDRGLLDSQRKLDKTL